MQYTRPDGEFVGYSYDSKGMPIEHIYFNAGGTEIFNADSKGFSSKQRAWQAQADVQELNADAAA